MLHPIARPAIVTALPPIKFDAAGRIDEDVSCRKCGYNLRGLLPDGRCPECGTAVGRSLHGDLLRFSDPEWVQKLASGMNWIVASIVIAFVVGIFTACGMSVMAILRGMTGFSRLTIFLPFFGYITGAVSLIGYWKVTSPDPARLGAEDSLTARKLIRITQTAGYVASPIQTFLQYIAPLYLLAVTPIHSAMSLTGNFATFTYARRLAHRIPDDKLARHCRIVMWGMAVMLVLTCAQVMTSSFATTAFTSMASATSAPASAPAISSTPRSIRIKSRAPIVTGPTTMPAVAVSPLTGAAYIGLSAAVGLGGLVFGIWALRILLKMRRSLRENAEIAVRSWAAQPLVAVPPKSAM